MLIIDELGHESEPVNLPWIECRIIQRLTARKNTIPMLYIKHSRAEYTIIFSHGNATDIGLMRNFLMDLAT